MNLRHTLLCVSLGMALVACQSTPAEEVADSASAAASTEALSKINDLGFSTQDVRVTEGGYIVEGDIFLSNDDLNRNDLYVNRLRVGDVEQYRTTNLVRGLPRTITVAVSNLPTVYASAATEAVRRYNALGLQLRFSRVSSSASITIVGFYEAPRADGSITLGSAGFPTSGGNPHNQIRMNTHPAAYGSNPDVNYLASVIQHEIGHCIGFRHTDYMDRSYSCGGSYYNEGASTVGAIRIPGTPSGPDPNSFMLACSNGSNRTFNANDRTALNYLY